MSPLAGMKHAYVRLAIVIFSHNITLQKGKKYETFFVSKLLNYRQKWVTDIRLVVRRVSPGRRIVVLF